MDNWLPVVIAAFAGSMLGSVVGVVVGIRWTRRSRQELPAAERTAPALAREKLAVEIETNRKILARVRARMRDFDLSAPLELQDAVWNSVQPALSQDDNLPSETFAVLTSFYGQVGLVRKRVPARRSTAEAREALDSCIQAAQRAVDALRCPTEEQDQER